MNYSIIHKKNTCIISLTLTLSSDVPEKIRLNCQKPLTNHDPNSRNDSTTVQSSLAWLSYSCMSIYVYCMYTSIQQLLRSPSFLVVRHHEYHFIWAIFARGSLDFLLAMIIVILSTQREDNQWIGDICFCHKTRSDDTHRNGTSVSSHWLAWR